MGEGVNTKMVGGVVGMGVVGLRGGEPNPSPNHNQHLMPPHRTYQPRTALLTTHLYHPLTTLLPRTLPPPVPPPYHLTTLGSVRVKVRLRVGLKDSSFKVKVRGRVGDGG